MTDKLKSELSAIGLLCNPLSGRIVKNPDGISKIINQFSGADYLEAVDAAGIRKSLEIFAAAKIDLLVIIGGDGTVHEVFTQLLREKMFRRIPLLTIIPGGTTNMTAIDLGICYKPEKALRILHQYLCNTHALNTQRRPILRIQQNATPPLYGVFFGTGIITDGVKYFRDRVKRLGITGEAASGIVMLRYLVTLLFGGINKSATQISLTGNGHELYDRADYLAVFASTLDRLLLGLRPYWGTEHAPIHLTVVRESPHHLWRSLPGLLSGNGNRLEQANGYHSCNLHTIGLYMESDFIIDGEVYSPDPVSGVVEITAEETLDFLIFNN